MSSKRKKISHAQRSEEREELSSIYEVQRAFHEQGLYLPTRTIFMGSETSDVEGYSSGCDAEMAKTVIKNIHILETLKFDCPINILSDNLGGDEYHGMAIMDAMMQSPCDIHMYVRGHAMSMGSLILQAADRRYVGPLSTQLLHYGTWGFVGHSKDAQKWAEEGKRLDAWMEQFYLKRIREKRPKFSLEELQEILRFDSFFTAQQSIDLGLADEIG